jgi:hypothetical protein
VSGQQREPGVLAAGGGADAGDLSQRDPLLRLIGKVHRVIGKVHRAVWYALAALALLGIGLAVGVSIPPSPGTPLTEQATVTWVNEGLPPPAGGGGPATFLARPDGARQAQSFDLSDTAEWRTAQNAGWTEGTIPSCMVPLMHGRPARDGVGDVRARIRFGVVLIQPPDGGSDDVVVWVECL